MRLSVVTAAVILCTIGLSTADHVRASGASGDSASVSTDQSASSRSESASEQDVKLEEIVVTATRQARLLSTVPISASAFSQKSLDAQGVNQIDDIALITPGVTFTRGNSGSTSIAIRGISSESGASTTGVYIDDTPVQSRVIGFSSTTVFPNVFDLERVEILRGPQGTLFGAGSEGGTVRFITPQPSLTEYTDYTRGELGFTEYGDPSFEAVDEQREIDVLAGRAVLAAVAPQGIELIFENELAVIQQAPDQRRLAIIDRAAREEAQQALGLIGHQKYPSRFFFSIDAASSLSMRRPERSDVRAIIISSMMSSSVAAVLSIAADNG